MNDPQSVLPAVLHHWELLVSRHSKDVTCPARTGDLRTDGGGETVRMNEDDKEIK